MWQAWHFGHWPGSGGALGRRGCSGTLRGRDMALGDIHHCLRMTLALQKNQWIFVQYVGSKAVVVDSLETGLKLCFHLPPLADAMLG